MFYEKYAEEQFKNNDEKMSFREEHVGELS